MEKKHLIKELERLGSWEKYSQELLQELEDSTIRYDELSELYILLSQKSMIMKKDRMVEQIREIKEDTNPNPFDNLFDSYNKY